MNKKIIWIIGIVIIAIAVVTGIILTEGGYLDSKSESDKTSMKTGFEKENVSGLEVVSDGEGVTEPGASYNDIFGKSGNKSDKKTKGKPLKILRKLKKGTCPIWCILFMLSDIISIFHR